MPKATASAAAGGLSEETKEMLLDAEIAANELMFAASIAHDLFKLLIEHKQAAPEGFQRILLSDLEVDRFQNLVQTIEEAAVRHAHAVAAIVAVTDAM